MNDKKKKVAKEKPVKKIIKVAGFKDLTKKEQDKILDNIIGSIDESDPKESIKPLADEIEKPTRVQFPKDATAEGIVDAIDKIQNEWAKRHPEKAHQLYPTVWDEQGNRIDGQ